MCASVGEESKMAVSSYRSAAKRTEKLNRYFPAELGAPSYPFRLDVDEYVFTGLLVEQVNICVLEC